MNNILSAEAGPPPIDRAIQIAGSAQALARALGVTRAAVSQWRFPNRRVPAQHCPRIERLTGGFVRCEDLRPDVDWSYLRTAKRKPPQKAEA